MKIMIRKGWYKTWWLKDTRIRVKEDNAMKIAIFEANIQCQKNADRNTWWYGYKSRQDHNDARTGRCGYPDTKIMRWEHDDTLGRQYTIHTWI